jgi:4'-phosphopantetheinyl transferase
MPKPILDSIPNSSSGDGKEADKGCNPYSLSRVLSVESDRNSPFTLMSPHRREHLAGNIVVWIAHVSKAQDSLPFLEPCLDHHDCERAARFRFPADRARFVLGRGMLRKCLGHYLERPPESVELGYTELGRPVFPADDKIQFSISHTQDLVALAVTDGAHIGIDLEAVQPQVDLFELAERVFSSEDLALFQAHPSGEKLAAFYRAWTRKEAYLKARGEGIAEGLQRISVSMDPEEVLSIQDRRHESAAEKWHLLSLPLPAGYAGTVACDDIRRQLEGTYVTFPQGEPNPESSWCFHSRVA